MKPTNSRSRESKLLCSRRRYFGVWSVVLLAFLNCTGCEKAPALSLTPAASNPDYVSSTSVRGNWRVSGDQFVVDKRTELTYFAQIDQSRFLQNLELDLATKKEPIQVGPKPDALQQINYNLLKRMVPFEDKQEPVLTIDHDGSYRDAALSSDGLKLLVAGEKLELWDIGKKQKKGEAVELDAPIQRVFFCEDTNYAIAWVGNTLQRIRIDSGEVTKQWKPSTGELATVDASTYPGRVWGRTDAGVLYVFDTTLEVINQGSIDSGALSFAPSLEREELAVFSNQGVMFFDYDNLQISRDYNRASPKLPKGPYKALFGKYIYAVSRNHIIAIRDIRSVDSYTQIEILAFYDVIDSALLPGNESLLLLGREIESKRYFVQDLFPFGQKYSRRFYFETPAKPIRVLSARAIDRLAFVGEKNISVYDRQIWRHHADGYISLAARRLMKNGQLEQLGLLSEELKVCNALSSSIHIRDIQLIFIDQAARVWAELPEEQLAPWKDEFQKWKEVSLESHNLAFAKMCYIKSRDQWNESSKEYAERGFRACEELYATGNRSPSLFQYWIMLRRQLEPNATDPFVQKLLAEFTELYPLKWDVHTETCRWLIAAAGRGDASAYARALAKCYPEDWGDKVYAALVAEILQASGISLTSSSLNLDFTRVSKGATELLEDDWLTMPQLTALAVEARLHEDPNFERVLNQRYLDEYGLYGHYPGFLVSSVLKMHEPIEARGNR